MSETTTTFESITCSRCGGTGRYSFNLMDGDKCYGCNGTGIKRTKRGQAACDYFNSLLTKPVNEIVVGDVIFYNGGYRGWFTVEEIKTDELNPGRKTQACRNSKGLSLGYGILDTMTESLRVSHTAEEKAGFLAKALDFQASLTKAGKPRVKK